VASQRSLPLSLSAMHDPQVGRGGRGVRAKPPELPSTAPWVRRIAGAQGWAGPHPPIPPLHRRWRGGREQPDPPAPARLERGQGGGPPPLPLRERPALSGAEGGQGGEDQQRIRTPSAKNSTSERGCSLPEPPPGIPMSSRIRSGGAVERLSIQEARVRNWPYRSSLGRITSTGTGAAWMTFWVTLPKTQRLIPLRPWVAMAIRSACWLSA